MEIEFYDYDTQGGVLELDNRPDDPMARRMLDYLLRVALPTELRAPLPASLRPEQRLSKPRLIAHETLLAHLSPQDYAAGALHNIFGYGANV